ncbi:hypothetical protein CRG98_029208 [Punica granatum]|uniref:Uncharacterized protein n=1 Tax=Punica granatum TaxID=22663 RepID=A0A2I0J378_PUNGR|nr:hypothetical protein CRG98_029208 [Punica granatum]
MGIAFVMPKGYMLTIPYPTKYREVQLLILPVILSVKAIQSSVDTLPEANGSPKKREKGLGPLVGDPDPTTEVADTHRRHRKHRGWGRGHRLVARALKSIGISSSRSWSIRRQGLTICGPTPPPWSPASSMGAYDLDGEVRVGVADRRPRPFPPFFFEF